MNVKNLKLAPLALGIITATSGCALKPLQLPEPIVLEKSGDSGADISVIQTPRSPERPWLETTPSIPRPAAKTTPTGPSLVGGERADITLAFDQMPLPSFIEAIYGGLLKQNYRVDPQIAARKDLVSLRVATPQTPTQVEALAASLLKTYGLIVMPPDPSGLRAIVPDAAAKDMLPEIRRGRALPEVPVSLRPVFQLVDLQSVRNTDVAGWMRTLFAQKLTVQEDPQRNAILLGGPPDAVAAALDALRVLDQPLMQGRKSLRINPRNWNPDDLAKKLVEVLQAEGVSAGVGTNVAFPLTLVPVSTAGAIIAFSANPAMLDHLATWAEQLDSPASTTKGRGLQIISYKAHHTDAEKLAATLRNLLGSGTGGSATAGTSRPQTGAPPQASTTPATAQAQAINPPRVVVHAATNTLIIQGLDSEEEPILRLLDQLDVPPQAALIEVTVAEVTLSDLTNLGIEWSLENAVGGGYRLASGTAGGLPIGSGGLNIGLLNNQGDTRMLLNALASNNKARILSTPRLLSRNGEEATIQVGQEVPIITSQQTTPVTGGTGGVLQSIQYRSTGVILKVRPVIHGDRVELSVAQEVSNAIATTTGVTNSPTISTRKVDTHLTLKDGATVVLGGLMSRDQSEGESGIPILKDLPGVGQLFRTNSINEKRTELIILLTPYVLAHDHEARAMTEKMREAFDRRITPRQQGDAKTQQTPMENDGR